MVDLLSRDVKKLPPEVVLSGRVLYLTEDPARARRLMGEISKTDPAVMAKTVLPVLTQSANVGSLQTLGDLLLDLGFIKKAARVDDFVWSTAR